MFKNSLLDRKLIKLVGKFFIANFIKLFAEVEVIQITLSAVSIKEQRII